MSRRQPHRFGNDHENQNTHLIGTSASVIQKHDQGTGRLTSGTIAEILTNSSFHPRGIKVRLVDGTVGRISSSTENVGGASLYDNDDDNRPNMGTASLYDNDDSNRPRQSHTLADYIMPDTSLPDQTSLPRHTHEQEHAQEYEQEVVNQNEDWACSSCTFVNSGLLPQCELCETTRVR